MLILKQSQAEKKNLLFYGKNFIRYIKNLTSSYQMKNMVTKVKYTGTLLVI